MQIVGVTSSSETANTDDSVFGSSSDMGTHESLDDFMDKVIDYDSLSPAASDNDASFFIDLTMSDNGDNENPDPEQATPPHLSPMISRLENIPSLESPMLRHISPDSPPLTAINPACSVRESPHLESEPGKPDRIADAVDEVSYLLPSSDQMTLSSIDLAPTEPQALRFKRPAQTDADSVAPKKRIRIKLVSRPKADNPGKTEEENDVVEELLAKWTKGKSTWYLVKWKDFPHEANTWEREYRIGIYHINKFKANYKGNHNGVELLDKRTSRTKVQYLVRWKGRPGEDSWESASTISSERIAEFEARGQSLNLGS